MPGIVPLKVITVGTSSQARVAQACDRCRSKKIRCDGTRPCCSQCANVGFECRTSDKLSRRAFPRGYTESLEERVRALESEVRELKDLLDEKDEIIDILERLHARTTPPRASSHSVSPRASQSYAHKPSAATLYSETAASQDDIFSVHPSVTSATEDDSKTSSDSNGNSNSNSAIHKLGKPSRKRFRSPFAEYPRIDYHVDERPAMPSAPNTLAVPAPSMHAGLAQSHGMTPAPSSSLMTPTTALDQSLDRVPEKRLRRAIRPNLDYFPLGSDLSDGTSLQTSVSPEEWEQLLGCVDGSDQGSYGTGGGELDLDLDHPDRRTSFVSAAYSSTEQLNDFNSLCREQPYAGAGGLPGHAFTLDSGFGVSSYGL
ncbi:MAG: hypothetical protein M1838_001779 [Thelocarpon superellum]|nr:MAG: hypothetical protein M1838_001779 [Thelocarpon superellum]